MNRNYSGIMLLCALSTVASLSAAAGELKEYDYIATRNVLRPLWRTAIDSADQTEAARRRQFDQMQSDQQKHMEEARLKQEAEQLAAKKQQLESQFEVTGIVDDDGRISAFVQNRKDGKTYTVSAGDEIDECRVTTVDNGKGEVAMTYKNQFQIKLMLK